VEEIFRRGSVPSPNLISNLKDVTPYKNSIEGWNYWDLPLIEGGDKRTYVFCEDVYWVLKPEQIRLILEGRKPA